MSLEKRVHKRIHAGIGRFALNLCMPLSVGMLLLVGITFGFIYKNVSSVHEPVATPVPGVAVLYESRDTVYIEVPDDMRAIMSKVDISAELIRKSNEWVNSNPKKGTLLSVTFADDCKGPRGMYLRYANP